MKRFPTAAPVALALALGVAPPHAAMAQADELIVVEVSPVATELASHLQVGLDSIPASVSVPEKIAAAVCQATLKQLRDSQAGGAEGRCVAVGMSQGLIEAVRRAMRGG